MNSVLAGTSVMKVMASDADDPTYGSSARIVYSVLDGEKLFTVDRHTGKTDIQCISDLSYEWLLVQHFLYSPVICFLLPTL